MSKNILFLLFPYFITGYALAQQNCFEVLDQTFDEITAQSEIAGFSSAMILPDGCLWKRATGLAEGPPDEQPLTTEHVMPIGSVTKSFVSTTMLLMMEDGLLDLDDSIGMYLAPYPNVFPQITIRQLLSHRSGVADYLPGLVPAFTIYPDSVWGIDTILNYYVPAYNFLPNEDWEYSNTNYLLASKIIENITGRNWYEVVRERVLDPLELTHTYAYPYEILNQAFAHAWDDSGGNGYEDMQNNGYDFFGAVLSAGAGAGGLISNPEDLARFTEQLHGGHLLQSSTLQEMRTNYNTGGSIYGLGTRSPGNNIWGHGGAVFYLSRAFYYTNDSMALVVQQNDSRVDGPNNPTIIDYRELEAALLDAVTNCVCVTSVREDKVNVIVSLAPNPAQDVLQLTLRSKMALGNASLEIFNPMARLVFTRDLEMEGNELSETLYVGQLPPGIYFLKIGLSELSVVRKFVKQ